MPPELSIQEATAFLYSLKPRGIRFGLENTRLVLDALGRPQDSFRVVHLAGSNGKGSSAAFLDRLLRQHGLRVGLYTSPHLRHFRERFRVDGVEVEDGAICRQVERLWREGLEQDPQRILDYIRSEDLVQRMQQGSWYGERGGSERFSRMTFFESTTVLAALLFAEAQVDVAIMECGMGGRLDATNVFAPVVCGLTPVSLEHTAWLGSDLASIAEEKAGLLKPGVPAVSAPQDDAVLRVFRRRAGELDLPLERVGEGIRFSGDWRAARFELEDLQLPPLRPGLVGDHQIVNAALALGCARHVLPLLAGKAAAALEATRWPGRFERLGPENSWVLDGAHNPAGCRVLASTWRQVFGSLQPRVIFGALGDKEVKPMLRALDPLTGPWSLVRPTDARGRAPEEFAALKPGADLAGTLPRALGEWRRTGSGPLLVCGSLSLVGEAHLWFEDNPLELASRRLT